MITLPMNVKYKNRKGQAILFAVVAVTIALAIGVTVASRNLSSISRVSRSDTSERAFAAAEGGIEKMLVLSGSELESMITPNATSCGLVGATIVSGSCEVAYPVVSGDPIVSKANVKVEKYKSTDTLSGIPYLALDINNGDTAEVTLRNPPYNGTLTICWDNPNAAIYYTKYNYFSSCSSSKSALRANALGNVSPNGFEIYDTPQNGFPRCSGAIAFSGNYDGLRIRALYGRTRVGIFTSNALPDQGYKLTSLGKISGQAEVVKKVVAFRSYPFMPSVFDAAILSAGGQIN